MLMRELLSIVCQPKEASTSTPTSPVRGRHQDQRPSTYPEPNRRRQLHRQDQAGAMIKSETGTGTALVKEQEIQIESDIENEQESQTENETATETGFEIGNETWNEIENETENETETGSENGQEIRTEIERAIGTGPANQRTTETDTQR